METEAVRVGVIMQRRHIDHRWQPYAWSPAELVFDGVDDCKPMCVSDDESNWRWLIGGMEVRLYSDEAEGYFLNATSPQPCWFIMWRLEEVNGVELAVPKAVTLSYNEAARMMDAGERVDTLPLHQSYVDHLQAFSREYYRPEPRKKARKPSFEGGEGVEQMAKAQGETHGSR